MPNVSESQLFNFFLKYPLEKYDKDEIILKSEEVPTFVGFIKSGYIRGFTINSSGREFSIPFFKSFLYFTAIYALNGVTGKLNFKAATPVEIWQVPTGDFLKFCRDNPMIETSLLKTASVFFLDLINTTITLLSGNAKVKVAVAVNLIKKDKANFPITHRMIASLTGLARETVTLQMIKLEEMKIVRDLSRTITVLDQSKLDEVIKENNHYPRDQKIREYQDNHVIYHLPRESNVR